MFSRADGEVSIPRCKAFILSQFLEDDRYYARDNI